jgi:hypothetical protein
VSTATDVETSAVFKDITKFHNFTVGIVIFIE